MEELAQEARSFDSKPKALSKGLGLGGGGELHRWRGEKHGGILSFYCFRHNKILSYPVRKGE